MANKHTSIAHSECSVLKQQLYKELCKLSRRELDELGAWRATVSQTVESIAVKRGCKPAQTNN